jgi:hypothetical protein
VVIKADPDAGQALSRPGRLRVHNSVRHLKFLPLSDLERNRLQHFSMFALYSFCAHALRLKNRRFLCDKILQLSCEYYWYRIQSIAGSAEKSGQFDLILKPQKSLKKLH